MECVTSHTVTFCISFVLPLQPARAVSARHTHRRSAKPFSFITTLSLLVSPALFAALIPPVPPAVSPRTNGSRILQQHHALVHQRRHHGQNEHAGHHEVQLKHLPAVYDQIPQSGLADEELARNNAHQ